MTGFWELLVILALIIFLFGAKQIPKLTKSIKESVNEFKKESASDEKTEEVEVAKDTKEE